MLRLPSDKTTRDEILTEFQYYGLTQSYRTHFSGSSLLELDSQATLNQWFGNDDQDWEV